MMGPYCYYDASYVEVHDCMWSGECYTCQQPVEVALSNGSIAIPIQVCSSELNSDLINSSTISGASNITRGSVWSEHSLLYPLKKKEDDKLKEVDEDGEEDEENEDDEKEEEPRSRGKQERGESKDNYGCQGDMLEMKQLYKSKRLRKAAPRKSYSSTDNKKLRHREVEKNRHRQLQAMVKSLSEKIPGRLDKETQVQTMKRAARYCIYLREVTHFLCDRLVEPGKLKETLEKIYNKSCDNVEQIMSS